LARTVVLKLGGSLLTDKKVPYSLRTNVIKEACKEIKECIDDHLIDQLIMVHGVGSYGHPPVMEHKLYKGFINPSQRVPLSWTQNKVMELRTIIIANLIEVDIPGCLMMPSSMALSKNGRIVSMYMESIRGFLDVGMVPLLGGDVIADSTMGFSVGSGDQVATMLAKEFHATDLIFATDVPYVYDGDPKVDDNARPLRELSLTEMKRLEKVEGMPDATGAMGGKLANLESIRPEIEGGLRTSIISMLEPGRLKKALSGGEVEGTIIHP